jgi:alpha-tubulin suppressor-like RCC1 family protein
MKLPLRLVLPVCLALSFRTYSQSTPQTIVAPGEYQCFFIKSADNSAYAIGGGVASLGIGSNPGTIGTAIPMAFPAGVKIKQISSPLHNGMAVDMNGNVWFWGLNDGGQRGDGTVGGAISYSPVQVTSDSLGNPFTNVNQLSCWYNEVTNAADSASTGTLACKNDGTVWIWGNTWGGMRGNGQQGGYNPKPVQVNLPGNPHIVKVLAGEICMALDNLGNVYTWGGNGRNTCLGTNAVDFTTPQKLNLPKPAKDIAGAELFEYALATDGTLYGWGIYGSYLGIGTGPYLSCNTFQPLPVDLTSDLNLTKPISSIMCNSVCTHVILSDSTLWGWGDNAQGNVGNGVDLNFATNNYQWDWGPGEILQNKPIQIEPLVHNFTNMFAGSGACFYMYAEDATGQLYSWGRNKSAVLANQVMMATSAINAAYPDGWEQPTITAVNPFALTSSNLYLSTCPACILTPTISPCNTFTIPTDIPPVSVPGPNQTITLPTTTTILDGTASHDPDGTVVYYKWRQVGGPSGNTVLDSTYAKTRIAGLVAGTYVYRLTVTDNGWDSSATTITVVVQNSSGNVPPTVSAGSNQTIELPTSSVTLTGTATGNNGATISSTAWTEVSGPVTATIASASALSTGVSGLTTAGTYVFQLKATDNNALTGTATVTITVQAAAVVPPTVHAGSDQTIQLPTSSVTLTGTATGNSGATISSTAWTEVSGPVTATIASASALSTGVSGLTTAGTYVFQLKATDNNGSSGTATVTVTVEAVTPPTGVPPTVSAGSDQTIQLPTSSATVTGTASGNGGATISSTAWTEVSGPVTATIAGAGSLSTGITGLTTAGAYVFQLKATDNNGLSTTAAVTITVDAAPPHVPPVANAGPNQTVTLPFTDITLDGSGSYDDDGTITTYSWVQVAGNGGVTIQGSSQVQPAIYGLTPGVYVFQLTVTDNFGAIGAATVTITVDSAAGARAPVANAGADTAIALPANSVVLDGSGSTDPGGEALTYQWSQVSGPGTATLGTSGNVTTTVGQLQAGLYVFQLQVTNTSGLSSTATVQVRVVNNERSADTGSAQFVVYPNPVASTLTIKFTDPGTSGKILIKIIDMRGTQLMTQEGEVSGGELINFNVSGLPKGVYALQVIVGSMQGHQLIVKQ